MSGSLGFQIEHHLFPDLPSNRYPEMAVRVRALCEKYRLPYTTGPLWRQYGQVFRTLMTLSLPGRRAEEPSELPLWVRGRRASPAELSSHRGPVAPQAAVA
jgi:linoleoyl-CoA desaturase